jgi:hypothetical protein
VLVANRVLFLLGPFRLFKYIILEEGDQAYLIFKFFFFKFASPFLSIRSCRTKLGM